MAKQHNQPYRLYKRGEIYHAYISFISETGERIKLRESTGRMAEPDAIKYCIKRITEINQKSRRIANGELEPITIADAFTRYFKEKGQYQANPKDLLYRLNNIRLLLNITYLHELDKETINNYVTQRRKTAKNSTINRDLAILSAVRNLADEFWEVKVNTAKPLKFKLKEPAENIKFLKDWEIAQRIVDNASPHLKPIIYTALYTGLRQSNILALKWSDVDFKNNIIMVNVKDRTKDGGKIITIPMIDKLKAILQEQPKINEYIFNYKGNPIKEVKRSWMNIFYKFVRTDKVTANDVIETRKKGDKVIIYKRVLRDESLPYTNFHTLRHTAATWILKKTNNLKITKEILGHANIQTTLKYAHILDDEKRNALNSVFE